MSVGVQISQQGARPQDAHIRSDKWRATYATENKTDRCQTINNCVQMTCGWALRTSTGPYSNLDIYFRKSRQLSQNTRYLRDIRIVDCCNHQTPLFQENKPRAVGRQPCKYEGNSQCRGSNFGDRKRRLFFIFVLVKQSFEFVTKTQQFLVYN